VTKTDTTVWVRNTETNLVWEVDPERARYLLGQRTSTGTPLFEKTAPPKNGRAAAK